ncbi:MAG TPA: protease modulator HflC [Gammaproteobacteria bacterium]|nr:protease modulator HflC [Gammaproteobacteria bacterium]
MHTLKTFFIVVAVIIVIALYSSMYTVSEGQQALLLRLGQIEQTADGKAKVIKPGLHFKIPFLNQVQKFDVRLQMLTVQSSRILTQDQKYVLVDYYIKWRIEDLPLYYQRTGGDPLRAETLLQQQVNGALLTEFGQRTLTEMVSGERVNVMSVLKDSANATAKNLGIWIADVRIKSIDLPKEVSEKVYNNMRTKREQDATQYRADGRAKAEAIKATAEAKAAIAVAQAQVAAANIRAQGVSQASQIYADAYSKSPEFYAFYRSLEAYKVGFNNKTDLLILTPDSEFFKYFNNLPGKAVSSQPSQATGGH